MKKPMFEITEDTQKCCDFLCGRDRVSYREISQHLGRDVQRRDRYVLDSARRKLETEGIVFVAEWGVGLVRANDRQVAELATSTPIERIRRTTKRAKKREQIVNVQKLSDADRAAFYEGRAVIGAISQAARKAFATKVAEAVNASNEPLSLQETMNLFGKLKPGRPVQ